MCCPFEYTVRCWSTESDTCQRLAESCDRESGREDVLLLLSISGLWYCSGFGTPPPKLSHKTEQTQQPWPHGKDNIDESKRMWMGPR
jgi:hypothetical protein